MADEVPVAPAPEIVPEPPIPAPPSTWSLVKQDAGRGARAALAGAAALAAFEYVVSLAVGHASFGFLTLFRFLALDLVLVGVALAALVPLGALVFAAPRLLRLARSAQRARAYPGFLAGGAAPAGFQPVAPWLSAGLLGTLGYAAASYGTTLFFMARFKERHLIAASLAAIQLLLVGAALALAFLIAAGLRRVGLRGGRWNPFGRVVAAGAFLALLCIPTLIVLTRVVPALRDVMPWRLLLAALVLVVAAGVAARRDLRLPRRALLLGVGGLVALAVPTLLVWGAHPEAKYLAMSASPPLSRLVDGVRWLNDFDRDGYGSLLGENDCAPFNKTIHPGARDLPDNGVDENCNGRDFSAKGMPSYKKGERMAVPPEFRRDWNVLLITVDALRYDHTGFGGYKKAKGRDTTPNLDALAARATSFAFAHAAAAGTMASVPAILAAKFFHSGIALGPERRPMPPKVLPQNTLIGEVMKKAGYRTGAILTHEYFNDWGLDQGFDSYDNALGAKPNPYGITSQDVTSKAEAWIAKQGTAKWFLWTHYLDPHGQYVAHPGETQYGNEKVDVYDGEIAYTDKHIGKLLEFIARSPAADRTIIIVTSDHGDGFYEHGFENHGMALYRELVNVPLVVYVPDNDPHVVEGPVSNIDILPTVADLVGTEVGDSTIEGESLVPQLFYGRDARERIIFTETNWPDPLRSAISDRYKLIYNLKANVYELYDLPKDPWEKTNIWAKDKAGGALMKGMLDEWLDRVYYARDPLSQAEQVRQQEFLSRTAPRVGHPTSLDAAELHVVGWDASAPPYAGKDVTVTIWFSVPAPPKVVYRIELSATSGAGDAGPRSVAARQAKTPAGDGIFPTTKWKPGDFVKETYRLKIPADARPPLDLELKLLDAGKPVGQATLGRLAW